MVLYSKAQKTVSISFISVPLGYENKIIDKNLRWLHEVKDVSGVKLIWDLRIREP